MASRTHFAAPLLLAAVVALILYVSLYPFRFDPDGPTLRAALPLLDWARASRSDMFNNLLLYMPLGFCMALLVEPRFGRIAGLAAGLTTGAALSLLMELLQASIAPRVPSLTDLSLNAAGSLAGAIAGSAWHALDFRMTPQATPARKSRAVALTILALWLVSRLWPLWPDPSLRQLKAAVRPLFDPRLDWQALVASFVGWLVVAQTVFHLVKRQRAIDVFLIVIATVLAGRLVTKGNALVPAELAAIALLLPVLVLVSRMADRSRSALVVAILGTWLAAIALAPMLGGTGSAAVVVPSFADFLSRAVPPPAELAGRGFSYLALAGLLARAGLYPHVAGGVTALFVLLLCLLQTGAAAPAYGWIDLVLAIIAGIMVARWMPHGAPAARA